MATLDIKMLEDFAKNNNCRNPHFKIFFRIEEDTLLGVSIRFFAGNGRKFDSILESQFYDGIEETSRNRVFPERNRLLKNGIIELQVNYIHKYINGNLVIRTINYIKNVLLEDANYNYADKGIVIYPEAK